MKTCEMRKECAAPVTHIGSRGWVYCAEHAKDRRASRNEQTRKMQPWELKLIAAGEPLPSYQRGKRPTPQAAGLRITEAPADGRAFWRYGKADAEAAAERTRAGNTPEPEEECTIEHPCSQCVSEGLANPDGTLPGQEGGDE